MSVTRWILLLLIAGVMAMLSVYAQRVATNLSYEKSLMQVDIKRLGEQRSDLEARIDSILTPQALAEHAKKFENLVPPGREQ